MSMHKFANAGPIMAGLAAMTTSAPPEYCCKCGQALGNSRTVNGGRQFHPECDPVLGNQAGFAPRMSSISVDDLVRMIENVADQLSEVAAQLVDMRRRINTLEANSLPRSLGDMEPAGEKVIRKQARGWTGLLHGTFNGA